MTSAPYYEINPAFCAGCGERLEPAPAKFDGEPGFSGYLRCWRHPKAETVYSATAAALIRAKVREAE